MNNELKEFIAHARKKDMDHATIRMLLLSNGWKEKEIVEAFSKEGLEMPIPAPPDAGGAREAFFHLISFAALYTMVISLSVLFFEYLNNLFDDPALEIWQSTIDSQQVRWSMSAVIVAFPVLIWMTRILQKEMKKHPEKSWSALRRWLTYITLFIAAFALGIDLITLLSYLLGGSLSVRFISKVFVVLVIAGLTFSYYFRALKVATDTKKIRKINRSYLSITSVIIVIAVVWGMILVGSPIKGRSLKFDERRIEDLQTINREIRNIVYEGEVPYGIEERTPSNPVPRTLEEVVEKALYERPDILDPKTGNQYEYLVKSSTRFELCAEFTEERNERYEVFWNHTPGTKCFKFDVTENLNVR